MTVIPLKSAEVTYCEWPLSRVFNPDGRRHVLDQVCAFDDALLIWNGSEWFCETCQRSRQSKFMASKRAIIENPVVAPDEYYEQATRAFRESAASNRPREVRHRNVWRVDAPWR